MATTRLPPDFSDFLRLLDSHGVEYLLLGGYAVGYHGYPRATAHMDVWVAIDERNTERLSAALVDFGFPAPAVEPSVFRRRDAVVRMGVPPLRIEVITSASGVDFADCYARRIVDTIDGVRVSIIDLESLKRNKRASGRHKDLADLESLP